LSVSFDDSRGLFLRNCDWTCPNGQSIEFGEYPPLLLSRRREPRGLLIDRTRLGSRSLGLKKRVEGT
jgi:hypothetical protein